MNEHQVPWRWGIAVLSERAADHRRDALEG
jgi:hypothetical protein